MENTIKIILNDYSGTCLPGQTLSGVVQCSFNEDLKCRAIKIRFKGRAFTEWREKRGKHSRSYTGEEMYFNTEHNLASDPDGGDDFNIPAGRHEYPFSYILPQQLPSSYQGMFGFVKYNIKATVDRPWKFDYEDKLFLNLFSPLDLNYMPNLRAPHRDSVFKEVRSFLCCGGSDRISLDVSLPVTGFVPGHEMTIGAYVQNLSNLNIEHVTYSIVEGVEFAAQYPHMQKKYYEDTITKYTESGIGAHSEKTWTFNFTVPTYLRYPNLIPCNIMNLSHYLYISLELPRLHFDLQMKIPITIGAVPLSGVNTEVPGPPPPAYPYNFNSAGAASAPPVEASQADWQLVGEESRKTPEKL